MKVINIRKSRLSHPTAFGYRVLCNWPALEVLRKEREIPRLRVPIEIRPPVAWPRLMVGVTKPNGEYSERRAEIDSVYSDGKAALIIEAAGDTIPIGSEVELLRYEI